MKEYQIEDTIVAYFDGRLNDDDSAELLHRVSVSPEIREIFQEHEAIRVAAYRAARNVTVSPELEDSVFARVAALEEASREKAVPVTFWTLPRISAVAGVAALIAIGLFAPWRASDTIVKQGSLGQRTEMTQVTSSFVGGSHIVETASFAGRKVSSEVASGTSSSSENMNSIADASPAGVVPLQSESRDAIQIIPQPVQSDHINMPSIVGNPPTLRSLSRLPDRDNAPMFEIGFATDAMPGFNLPGNVVSNPLPTSEIPSEFAFRAAFNFDPANQIGFRFTRVGFPDLQTISTPLNGYALVTGSTPLQVGYSEEVFYKHRVPIDDGLFYLSGSIGGGFYSEGTLFSGELGLEVPVSDRLLGGVSLIVSKLHQNGSEQGILSGDEPVIYDGPNVYNTLAGRIEYGMIYRF
jgi:hypothetical protein